ncbi:MAG: tyrosine-type recombinase/integrase [Acidobacteria bacterium]|nr:tyrosine-type recombinase/integrase [Acidobacteriota bacterium]MBI3428021.1 tyrosine-type recombinase/integrase [Acidobacteriota bacterium]
MARERSGSIKFNKDQNDFVVRVTYHDEQGKRHDLRRRAASKTDASRELKRLLRTLDDHGGRSVDGARLTFNELAKKYTDKKLIPPVYKGETRIAGLRSWQCQLGYLKNLSAFFGKQRIQSITHSDLEKYRAARLQTNTIRGKERTITGVNRELSLMRAMMNFARRNGWITRNPFEQGESLISHADENRRDRILTEDEEARLLSVCDGRRAHLRPLIIAAIDTAMRHGELLQLKWSDVNFEANVIRVRKTTTKTWESRTIGLTTRLSTELQRLWERGTGNRDELVFGLTNNVKHSFTTARNLAQLDDLHFHDLRHVGTTRMIRAGMPPMEVMKITGHKQISTFLRYMNVDQQTARRAAQALDNLYMPEVPTLNEYVN